MYGPMHIWNRGKLIIKGDEKWMMALTTNKSVKINQIAGRCIKLNYIVFNQKKKKKGWIVYPKEWE